MSTENQNVVIMPIHKSADVMLYLLKNGRCPDCGMQTHDNTAACLTPITSEYVLSGRCLLCRPLNNAAFMDNEQQQQQPIHHCNPSSAIPNPSGIIVGGVNSASSSCSLNDISEIKDNISDWVSTAAARMVQQTNNNQGTEQSSSQSKSKNSANADGFQIFEQSVAVKGGAVDTIAMGTQSKEMYTNYLMASQGFDSSTTDLLAQFVTLGSATDLPLTDEADAIPHTRSPTTEEQDVTAASNPPLPSNVNPPTKTNKVEKQDVPPATMTPDILASDPTLHKKPAKVKTFKRTCVPDTSQSHMLRQMKPERSEKKSNRILSKKKSMIRDAIV